jgi:hypothetical protein
MTCEKDGCVLLENDYQYAGNEYQHAQEGYNYTEYQLDGGIETLGFNIRHV